jgi:ADP-heptose:LPS heptosyltransferase
MLPRRFLRFFKMHSDAEGRSKTEKTLHPINSRVTIRASWAGLDFLPMSRSTEFQRRLDRAIGIPIVCLIGFFGQRRPLPDAPKRIGVIQPSAIGDMVLISGLLLHLRRCYPDAEIHVFHGLYNAEAVQLLPIDLTAHSCDFRQPLATLRRLRSVGLDVLINSAPWTRLTAALAALSNARVKIGFRSAGQYIHSAFDIAVPYLNDRHEIENHRAFAELFHPLAQYTLQLKGMQRASAIDLPYDRLVLMHMFPGGSRARQKSWPAEYWIRLARSIAKQGWVIGFTGAEADREALTQFLSAAGMPEGHCMALAGRLSLAELCDVMGRARLLVTIDTGIAHLAAALNARVVGLYGPTRSERWGCRSERAVCLNSPHPAAGYINYGFEQHADGDKVMAALSVNTVQAAVEAVLKRTIAEHDHPQQRALVAAE